MIAINEWIWVFDTALMLCQNVENKIVVDIERTCTNYIGRHQNIPMAIFEEIAGLTPGEKIIEQIAINSDNDFFNSPTGK